MRSCSFLWGLLFVTCAWTSTTVRSESVKAGAQRSSFKDNNGNVNVQVSVGGGNANVALNFYASSLVANDGVPENSFDPSKNTLSLVYAGAADVFGCKHGTTVPVLPTGPWAHLVERGSCPFQTKVEVAQKLGASAVFVLNNVNSLYRDSNATTSDKVLKDTCSVFAHVVVGHKDRLDCDSGTGCGADGECSSGVCIPFRAKSGLEVQSCCLSDELMAIHYKVTETSNIGSLFVNVGDSNDLRKIVFGNQSIVARLSQRTYSRFDFSSVMVCLIAVVTLAIGTYRGTRIDRMIARRKFATGRERDAFNNINAHMALVHEATDAPESQRFSVKLVIGFVVMSAAGLLLVYMLVKLGVNIIDIFNVWFVVVSSGAVGTLCIRPFHSKRVSMQQLLYPSLSSTVTRGDALQFVLGLIIPIWWYVANAQFAKYAWVLQNVLGAVLCCLMVLLVRLPNLRIAAYLSIVFLVYDVFMVFITPLIAGESIMMEVATAGGRNRASSVQQNTTVGEEVLTACARTPAKHVPLLMQVPHFQEWPTGGAAMLGFGDIMLPSLFLALMLRYDYLRGTSLCCVRQNTEGGERTEHGCLPCTPTYWAINMVFYAIALGLANLANIQGWTVFGVRGQPALLYINPLTLFPTMFVAWQRGHLGEMWNKKVKDDADAPSEGSDSSTVERSAMQIELAERGPEEDLQSSGSTAPLIRPKREGFK